MVKELIAVPRPARPLRAATPGIIRLDSGKEYHERCDLEGRDLFDQVTPLGLFEGITCVTPAQVPRIKDKCRFIDFFAVIEPHPAYGLLWHTLDAPLLGRSWQKKWATPEHLRAPRRVTEPGKHGEGTRPEREVDMRRRFAATLREQGVDCGEEILCAAGIADVVDPVWVYELKVSPSSYFHAIGQAILYGASLGRKPCVVFPCAPEPHICAAIEAAGVRLEVFAADGKLPEHEHGRLA